MKNYSGASLEFILMAATTDLPQAAHDPLTDAIARWRATVEAELKGVPFEKKLVTRTFEGIALQPLYTRADLAALPAVNQNPGAAPFCAAHGRSATRAARGR